MPSLMRFLGGIKQPFHNLTAQQRFLQLLRFGASIVTFSFAIAFLSTRYMTRDVHVARINSAHLDVAMGLYKSLRTSISSTSATKQVTGDILPSDQTLTDSEISILTAYTEKQVADAAQYILLGSTEFCMVSYQTSYNPHDRVLHQNVTQNCLHYGSEGIFDYRSILLEAGLTIILAYAYESSFMDDDKFSHQCVERSKQFSLLPKFMVFEIIVQIVIFIYGLVLYSNRGASKDLTNIPSITLNLLAVISVAAGVSILTVVGLVNHELNQISKEIAKGMSNFGIEMKTGKVFLFLIWATATFATLTMFSWAIPIWCSNPTDDGYNSDDDTFYQYRDEDPELDKDEFVAKPYHAMRNLKRKKVKKSISRLFDDTAGFPPEDYDMELGQGSRKRRFKDKNPFLTSAEERELSNDTIDEPQMVELSSKYQTESELRKLGETMARKISVRRLGTVSKPKAPHRDWLPEKEATQNLLYGDNGLSDHKYPSAFQAKSDNNDLSRNTTMRNLGSTRNSSKPTSGFQLDPSDENNGAYDDISVLEEQEMEFLDNNHFINKIV